MTRRYALTDVQWERIQDLLPGRAGHVGRPASNNRLFVDAVLYRYRAGIPWRDLPEHFGDFRVVHLRHSRWSRSGVWQRVFEVFDLEGADALLPGNPGKTVIADKAYDAHDRVIEPLWAAGKQVVIPSRRRNKAQRECDAVLYKARHAIENFFARLKQWRAIATRYDKTACNFLGTIHLVSVIIWMV